MSIDTKNTAVSALARFWHAEDGATAIEYGLIAAATGLALVSVMPAFASSTNAMYGRIVAYFDNV